MLVLTRIAALITIIGGLNWGLVGAFNFNLVESLFGEGTTATMVVYIVVGVSAIITLLIFSPSITQRRAVEPRYDERVDRV